MKEGLIKLRDIISYRPTQKEIYFWNAAGSAATSFATLFLLLGVTRIMGPVEAGIFSIGFALAQQVWSVVNCEMVTFQATDRDNKYSFAHYNGSRVLLFLVSMIVISVLVYVRGYDAYKAIVVILLCLYKCLDALSASFFALFQKNERLDIAGKSMTYKTCLSIAGFIIACMFCDDMFIPLIIMNIIYFIGIFLFDIRYVGYYDKLAITFEPGIFKLLIECFPLFIGSFMTVYICNQPKYVLDAVSTPEMQTAFNIIVMPAFVINLLSMFAFRPFLTTIAQKWRDKDIKEFMKIDMKLYGFIILCTVVCVVGGWLIGIPVLSLVYGMNLSAYKMELCVILMGGGMNAVAVLSYNILSAIRHQNYILWAYAIAFIASLVISKPLIMALSMMGASLSYAIPFIVIAIVLILCIIMETIKRNKE